MSMMTYKIIMSIVITIMYLLFAISIDHMCRLDLMVNYRRMGVKVDNIMQVFYESLEYDGDKISKVKMKQVAEMRKIEYHLIFLITIVCFTLMVLIV